MGVKVPLEPLQCKHQLQSSQKFIVFSKISFVFLICNSGQEDKLKNVQPSFMEGKDSCVDIIQSGNINSFPILCLSTMT